MSDDGHSPVCVVVQQLTRVKTLIQDVIIILIHVDVELSVSLFFLLDHITVGRQLSLLQH